MRTTTFFLYQAGRLAELSSQARHVRLLVHDGMPLVERVGAGPAILTGCDAQGSAYLAIGAPQHRCIAYTVYGYVPPERLAMPLDFTGAPVDPLTGNLPLGSGRRTYDPLLGRFHSADEHSPFGKGGPNAYAYCQGDPVNRGDPEGTFWRSVFKLSAPVLGKGAAPNLVAIGDRKRNYLASETNELTQALLPRPDATLPSISARQHIDAYVSSVAAQDQAFFTRNLDYVNKNLWSHGNTNLSQGSARHYVELARQVQAGELSSSSAHLSAAAKWLSEGKASGALANVAALLRAGVEDHRQLKTWPASAP